jgi:cytochrome oxidase assembly protein ShyY1
VRQVRFLFHPRWLLSHLLVAALFVLFVLAGFWQLDRLDQRRDRNDLIESRATQAEVPIEDLLAPGDGDDAVGEARFRAVTATGTYDDDATVAVRNRTQNGVPGAWMLTPLVLDGGDRVGVVRGFVAIGPDNEPVPTTPPEGTVMVTGVAADPTAFDGTAPRDAEKVVDQPDTLPGVVLAESSDPPEPAGEEALGDPRAAAIVPVAPPELGEGPHLSYAVQWFIFATIGLVGYPLILRRVVQRRGKEAGEGDGGGGGPDRADDLDRELAELLRNEPRS